MNGWETRTCTACNGSGKDSNGEDCLNCDGKGTVEVWVDEEEENKK